MVVLIFIIICAKKKKNFFQNPAGRLAIADVEVQGLQL